MSTKKAAKTQLERAALLVRQLAEIPGLATTAEALTEIVAEAQNRPPEGAADGTIHEPLWIYLRAVAKSLNNFNTDIERALVEIEIGEVRARRKKLNETRR